MENKDNLVYDHFIVPVGLHYYGITDDLDNRKRGSYKRTSLQPYIDEYGWDNINTTIVVEGLTRQEALKFEDKLIKEGWKFGNCINKQRSGGNRWRSGTVEVKIYNTQYQKEHKEERKEYNKQYYQDHKEELLEQQKQYYQDNKEDRQEYNNKYHWLNKEKRNTKSKLYYQDHKEELLEQQHQYYQDHKEEIKQYKKQVNSTPEGKIYSRVKAFNRYHPDKAIETPKEAKQKYLETGYIPSYIKNNDLK